MATIVLGVAGAAVPGVGWILGAVGAAIGSYIDNRWTYPALFGEDPAQQAQRILDMPRGVNGPGAPRVWAIGNKIRVPCHVMWQTSKGRDTSTSSPKGGTSVQQHQVIFNFAVHVNDRPTVEVAQLAGNGKLLTWNTRNLVVCRTSGMTLAVVGTQIVLTMNDSYEPAFGDYFVVGDRVVLDGWHTTAGIVVNDYLWAVAAVTGHTNTPSTITLDAIDGQSVAGIVATAGTVFSPAGVSRADDRWCDTRLYWQYTPYPRGAYYRVQINKNAASGAPFSDVLAVGQWVKLRNWVALDPLGAPDPIGQAILDGPGWYVVSVHDAYVEIHNQAGSPSNVYSGTGARQAVLEPLVQLQFSSEVLPNTGTFYTGSETQTADPLIEDDKGAGEVPSFRGIAYSVHDQFNATQFGNSLPASFEALINVDRGMTWQTAVAAVLMERGNLDPSQFDVSGITTRPFDGYWVQGPLSAAEVLQPLLLGGMILTQERGDVLAFFHVETADVVQIRNGANRSDLGSFVGGSNPEGDQKILLISPRPQDLPTMIGVRHQDIDRQYTIGYQPFGIRNTSSPANRVQKEVNLSQLAMTRRSARNLAATLMRQYHANARTGKLVLSPQYAHVQENDVLTVTDDSGQDLQLRVVTANLGANYLLECEVCTETLNLAVTGSPVQIPTTGVRRMAFGGFVAGFVFDCPATVAGNSDTPGLVLMAACDTATQHWSGCTVFESQDGEQTWNVVGAIGTQSAIGVTTADLPASAAAETYGSSALTVGAGTLSVELRNLGPIGTLASVTQAQAAAGANWCIVRDDATQDFEILAFTTATQTGTNAFDLTGLLRGLRGTRALQKLSGCTFALLWPLDLSAIWRTWPGAASNALAYRFVPPGRSLEDSPTVGVTAQWRNCSPLPIRSVTKAINGSTSVRFTIGQQDRTVRPAGYAGSYQLDEPYEEYRVELWSSAGTACVLQRTITARNTGARALRDRWVDFTAAECATAGYASLPGASFYVNVVQLGAFGNSPDNLQLI